MRLHRIVPLLLTVVLLAGCGQKELTPTQEKRIVEQTKAPFETTAHMTFQEMEATVVLQKDQDLTYHLTFQEPEVLQGMEVDFTQQKVTFRYRGLELEADPAALSSSAAVKLLAATLDQVAEENGLTFSLEDGCTVISGEQDGSAFSLVLDSATGNFLSLEVPESNFALEFSGFHFF